MNTKTTSNMETIKSNHCTITPEWTTLHTVAPSYFWDEATGTLGLNGDWESHCIPTSQGTVLIDHNTLIVGYREIRHLYLGAQFTIGDHTIFKLDKLSKIPVTVSPDHPQLTTIDVPGKDGLKGIPVWKETGEPALEECAWTQDGKSLYGIARDGKWGVIDEQGHIVVPLRYGVIWPAYENDLFIVMRDEKTGLVDLQGNEVVPLMYDTIFPSGDNYEATLGDDTFLIDKDGNKIEKDA